MAIGNTVWIFDQNRRVYAKDEHGRSVGGPIFREHFRPTKIVGETTRSWVLEYGAKIPKNGGNVRTFNERGSNYPATKVYMSQQAVDDACFLEDHQYCIGEAVRRCNDVSTLRQIAALVGYKETP